MRCTRARYPSKANALPVEYFRALSHKTNQGLKPLGIAQRGREPTIRNHCKSMKVAAAQARSVWLNKTKTTQKIIEILVEAAQQHVDLVAFPETFLAGYPFWVCRTEATRFDDRQQKQAYAYYLEAAVEITGPELQLITEAAKDLGIFVYLGIAERGVAAARGTVYCTLVAIDPHHGIVSSHRKLMPTWDERLVWGTGDGQGLRVHEVNGVRVGGLNCWENWMPLARFALYAGGEDLHIGTWPGNDYISVDATRLIALEGRVWSLAVHGVLSITDIPPDFPFLEVLRERGIDTIFNGGSAIVDPTGQYVAGPVLEEETLVTAEIDVDLVRQERANFDPTGHYSRADVFQLTVNRQRLNGATFLE